MIEFKLSIGKNPSKSGTVQNQDLEKQFEWAVSLMQYHTKLLWQEFGAILLAETVLIGFLGDTWVSRDSDVDLGIFVFCGALFGLILSIFWLSTFEHNYQYYRLRIAQARRCEDMLGIKLLSEGEAISSGELVQIGCEKIYHPLIARQLPPRRAFRWLIFLFGLSFIIFAIVTFPF